MERGVFCGSIEAADSAGRKDPGKQRGAQGGQLSQPPDGRGLPGGDRTGIPPAVRRMSGGPDSHH